MLNRFLELTTQFKQTHPTANITFKQKAHGLIMYINNQTAFNTDDMGMYNTQLRLQAMTRAYNNSKEQ